MKYIFRIFIFIFIFLSNLSFTQSEKDLIIYKGISYNNIKTVNWTDDYDFFNIYIEYGDGKYADIYVYEAVALGEYNAEFIFYDENFVITDKIPGTISLKEIDEIDCGKCLVGKFSADSKGIKVNIEFNVEEDIFTW